MDKLTSILVGIDFTPCSMAALKQAMLIAAPNNASLRAVHVIDTLVVVDLQEALSEFQKDIQSGLINDAQRAWEKLEPEFPGKKGVALEVAIGSPAHAVLELVKKGRIDLLVLGVHGSGSASDGAGELAAACVRRSPSKVLLVREPHEGPFKKIVVGVDFSDTSFRALETAAQLAVQYGSEVLVAHVFQPPWRTLHYFAPTAETSADFQKQYRDGLSRRLEAFCARLGPASEKIKLTSTLVEHTSDGRGISDFAKKHAADLLIIGTQGRTNLGDVLLGSTAERVLKQAPCSILTVRAKA